MNKKTVLMIVSIAGTLISAIAGIGVQAVQVEEEVDKKMKNLDNKDDEVDIIVEDF